MDGISALRRSRHTAHITLRELAEDLADYASLRPEAVAVVDQLASYISGLHPADAEVQGTMRSLLPGEAADVLTGANADHWIGLYTQLMDAAEVTGIGVEVQVRLLSRLNFWRMQPTINLAGEASTPRLAVGSEKGPLRDKL